MTVLPAPRPLGQHVVLIGLMGSGKTTVGRIVARSLGRELIDSDEQVEDATGRTVREIWVTDGEPAFRSLEKRALREALTRAEPAVIAAAGGVVLDPDNRALLSGSATVVWLDGEPETLASRAATDDHRPLLDDDPAAALGAMAEQREPFYAEVADVRIDIDGDDADEVAQAVLEAIL